MTTKWQVLNGNSFEVLKTFPDNHFDSVVTDPPYLIGFLGKDWDHENNDLTAVFKECFRVLKPGGHLLSFSAARTYHRVAVMIEDAGFEIRDQLMWLYSSGFPKSQDVGRAIQRQMGVKERAPYKHNSPRVGGEAKLEDYGRYNNDGTAVCTDEEAKKWEGWGTALKPAHEPIVMARKPAKKSIVKNVQEHGTGALNIDGCRVSYIDKDNLKAGKFTPRAKKVVISEANSEVLEKTAHEDNTGWVVPELGRYPSNVIGEVEGYQKYFYYPKVSRKERHIGYDDGSLSLPEMVEEMGGHYCGEKVVYLPHSGLTIQVHGMRNEYQKWCVENGKVPNQGNNHPTVKPVALMAYLCRLVTPLNGHVLDPFNGSGSTGMASVQEGFNYTGIELDPNYCEIARKRIDAWNKPTQFDNLFE